MPKEVIELHFICRRDRHVVPLPDGLFDTGHWKVAAKHLGTVKHVALHERRDEPSYLQGELVSFEKSTEVPDRFVLRVRPSATPLEWPPGSGAGEKGYRWTGDTGPRQPRMPNSLMYDCDVKVLFKVDGVRELRWVTRLVAKLDGGASRAIRCAHCHGEVRVHKQRVPHGPTDHVEHLHRQDAVNCKGGHDFGGTHQMSTIPVA